MTIPHVFRNPFTLLLAGVGFVIAAVPFHALLTVWAASFVGQYTALRLWKEGLLALLVLLSIVVLWRNPALRKRLSTPRSLRQLWLLIALYIGLHVVGGGLAWLRGEVNAAALGYALVSNLRFLVFFGVCVVAAAASGKWFRAHWQHVLLWPAALVVLFGLLQFLVLPPDILRHVGYGPEAIRPVVLVDNKEDYARVQSTMRGPNPLGAYLVIIVAALFVLFVCARRRFGWLAFGLLASLLVLYATYSRSAWIGVAAATAVVVWGLTQSARTRKRLLVGVTCVVLVATAGLVVLRDNDHVQNVLFHTDETSRSDTSSNEDRANAITSGLGDIVREPLGGGPGTAGPASVHNDAPARISENYFIQIGQEVGVAGALTFIAICGLVGSHLWARRKDDTLALIVIASFVGLVLVNLLSHAWADDTLAYVWWGLAGLCVGAGVSRKTQNSTKGA